MFLATCFGDVTLKFCDNLCYKERGDISVIIEDHSETDDKGRRIGKDIFFDLKEHEALHIANLLCMAVKAARAENDRMQFENPNEY